MIDVHAQQVLGAAARHPLLTTGDRLVLAVLMQHDRVYEEADPIAWCNRTRLAVVTGMRPLSVKRSLARLRSAGFVGRRVSDRRGIGYQLGPATMTALDLAALLPTRSDQYNPHRGAAHARSQPETAPQSSHRNNH